MATMLGYHRRYGHYPHHQENREENHRNHEHWHTTPLRALCGGNELASVIEITDGCEVERGGWRDFRPQAVPACPAAVPKLLVGQHNSSTVRGIDSRDR